LSLSESKFAGAEFFHTSLKDIDFTTCVLDAISVSDGAKELNGAIVNIHQAADLSALLGLIIK
ncbi:MAG: pentapeptide repeat-containing protein, partial [Ruthenibacterium sp.]